MARINPASAAHRPRWRGGCGELQRTAMERIDYDRRRQAVGVQWHEPVGSAQEAWPCLAGDGWS